MEIALSWPIWLRKVLLVILGILILASFTHQVLVSAMAPKEVLTSFSNNVTFPLVPRESSNEPIWKRLQISSIENPSKLKGIKSIINTSNVNHNSTQSDRGKKASLWYSSDSEHDKKLSSLGSISEDTKVSDNQNIFQEESLVAFNETFWELLDCEEFLDMDEPPSFIEWIPPPPIPPFLSDREILLSLNEEDLYNSNKITFDDQFCTLCSWAKSGLNYSRPLELPKKQETKSGISRVMVGTLIGVAVFSAAMGAALVALLFKCRKQQPTAPERTNGCSLVMYLRRWLNTSTHKIHHQNNTRDKAEPDASTTAAPVENSEHNQSRTIALRLWGSCNNSGCSRPSNMQTSSPDSENSCYSEEHYISGDTGSSVVYAELASHCNSQQLDSHPTSEQHHYSEIEDICRLSNMKLDSSEETYENLSFILPDGSSSRVPNDGSIYSASHSVPSSAYYSDISSCELYAIQRNQRSKRKRKRNVRSNSERTYPFVVSSTAPPFNQLESRIANIQPLHLTQHQHNCIPDTLQIISNANQSVDPSRYQGQQVAFEGLAIHNSSEHPQNFMPCGQLNNIKSTGRPPCDTPHSINLYELSPNQQCLDENSRRNLTQLPYRQMSFPNNKRHLRTLIQAQNIASVPSEYI